MLLAARHACGHAEQACICHVVPAGAACQKSRVRKSSTAHNWFMTGRHCAGELAEARRSCPVLNALHRYITTLYAHPNRRPEPARAPGVWHNECKGGLYRAHEGRQWARRLLGRGLSSAASCEGMEQHSAPGKSLEAACCCNHWVLTWGQKEGAAKGPAKQADSTANSTPLPGEVTGCSPPRPL